MNKSKKQRPQASVAAEQADAAEKFILERDAATTGGALSLPIEGFPFDLEPVNRRACKENEPLVLPQLMNIEFSRLALHFRRQAKGNSELAHKMAWEWLKGGFPFYPPPEISQSELSAQLLWHAQASARVSNAERKAWKVDTEPLIKFEEACRTDWCRYKSERELISMLKRVGYPEIVLSYGLINRPAYEVALQKDHERSKERAAKRCAKCATRSERTHHPPSRCSSCAKRFFR